MMVLRILAVSISSRIQDIFLKGRCSGSVTCVYSSAANFSFGKYLITAADKAQGNLPYRILSDLLKIDPKQVLHRVDNTEIDANSLQIGNGSFEILFQGALVWSREFQLHETL